MKRILSVIIALALLIGVMPLAVFAEGGTVASTIAITYDTSMVITTTRLTGEEVTVMLREAVTSPKGTGIDDPSQSWLVYVSKGSNYTGLVYKDEDDRFVNIYDSTEKLDPSREYYYWFNVENNDYNDFYWDVDNLPSVTVNGVAADVVCWNGQSETGDINVYIKAPLDETGDAVALVEIAPERTVVQRGTQKQFETTVYGTSDLITWSVSGNSSPSTYINPYGVLTVTAGETAEKLTVTAKSKVSAASDSAEVALIDEPVRIESVTVDPVSASVKRGEDVDITAAITGTDVLDLAVELTGANSYYTTWTEISRIGNTYVYRITPNQDETAETLTLVVTSVADPTKTASATIAVLPGDPVAHNIELQYNASAFTLTTDMTGRQASEAFRDSLITKYGTSLENPDGWFLYCDRNSGSYTSLARFNEEQDRFDSVYNSDEKLNLTDEYYLYFNIENCSGFEWDLDNLPSVTVNGTPADVVCWRSKAITGDVDAFVKVTVVAGTGVIKGDMDHDGGITVADALKALRIAAKLVAPTEEDIALGDVDNDGEITVADALKILRVAAKLADASSLE
ncbi:MAG: dockerin type I repeat-containing protein [Clostridia bacterium]|nr:dockerin type I repeat-containing protein [Clostridia bacterium]